MKKLINCLLLLFFCFGITSAAPTSCSGTIYSLVNSPNNAYRVNEDLVPGCIPESYPGQFPSPIYSMKYTSGVNAGVSVAILETQAGTGGTPPTMYDKIWVVVPIPDGTIVGDSFDLYLNGEQLPLSSSVKKPVMKTSSFQKVFTQNVFYDIMGRKIANANRAAYGLNLIRLPNGTMVKNLNFNRLH